MAIRISGFFFCLLLFSAVALAQPSQTPAPRSQATQSEAPSIDLVKLREFLEQQQATVERLQRTAAEGLEDARAAEQRFDEVIRAYENLIEEVGSGSANARLIEAFAVQYDEYAREAGGSTSATRRGRAEEFRKIATDARNVGQGFIEQSNRAYAQIARLKELKIDAVDEFRLGRGRAVVESFRAQLVALTAANDKVGESISQLSTLPGAALPQ